jgi:Flp pilus assembly protein TadG
VLNSTVLRTSRRRFLADQSGSTAVEFVLILPALLALLIGTINLSVMIFSYTALHYAAEAAARCATAQTSVCTNKAATESFAGTAYKGPGAAAFTYSQTTDTNGLPLCNQVVGTLSYDFTIGIASMTVPLSATACYPLG